MNSDELSLVSTEDLWMALKTRSDSVVLLTSDRRSAAEEKLGLRFSGSIVTCLGLMYQLIHYLTHLEKTPFKGE